MPENSCTKEVSRFRVEGSGNLGQKLRAHRTKLQTITALGLDRAELPLAECPNLATPCRTPQIGPVRALTPNLEALKSRMKVGRTKDPFYKDSYLGNFPT